MKHLINNLMIGASLVLTLAAVSTAAQAQNAIGAKKVAANVQVDPNQGNVILRVDTKTNALAIMTADEVKTEAAAQELAKNTAAFKPLATPQVRGELDRDGATSSWYRHYGYGFGAGVGFGFGYPNYGYGYNYGYPYNYGTPYAYDNGYAPNYYYGGVPYLPYYSYGAGGYNYYYYGRGGGWGGYGRGYAGGFGGGRGGYAGGGHAGGGRGHR